MVKSDLEERIAKCERILAENPESTVFAALADAYRRAGDLTRAAEVCANGLTLHPDYSTAHIVMAKIHLDQQMYDQAERELSMVRGEETGQNKAVEMLLADIAVRRRDYPRAKEILRRIIGGNPDHSSAKSLLDLVEREGRPAPPPPPAVQKPETTAEEVLNLLSAIEGVYGVMVLGRDGLPVASRFQDPAATEAFAAMSAAIVSTSDLALTRMGVGAFEHCLIETSDRIVWVFSYKRGLMVVSANNKVGLGPLKIAMERALAVIQ